MRRNTKKSSLRGTYFSALSNYTARLDKLNVYLNSVDEFVYMTENGYTKDEILKGERIILQTLDFTVSSYCSPYSWVRRISKADDYDIQTRTLSKFLMEVTLLDHRFLRAKPSMIAAIGMYLARKMLGGDWVCHFPLSSSSLLSSIYSIEG